MLHNSTEKKHIKLLIAEANIHRTKDLVISTGKKDIFLSKEILSSLQMHTLSIYIHERINHNFLSTPLNLSLPGNIFVIQIIQWTCFYNKQMNVPFNVTGKNATARQLYFRKTIEKLFSIKGERLKVLFI
ncbi:hypothetical protein EGW08_010081 [Elysia chlorotica]|uniref:Uncharacterized protein n=1 Tax=Elysia chlorotica TaxID=188477 RepID=A0A433TKM1_ELYCH|nr:hypothetical protein EGW08_010081 [Elysia chlorotica]